MTAREATISSRTNTSDGSSMNFSTSRSTGNCSTDLPLPCAISVRCATWGGPGHVARYLRQQGTQVCGIDLSAAMVKRAQQLVPGVEFRQGDMTSLDAPDGAWAGITA